ncbi:TetR/AcrR family transcriptional regulator [Hoeflea sp. YIM 152468]|uniref:TetR/AcrR family transcriptional regulator n=1 Tax=Hoeflea sp. YIM 152468 TaxID=3031759 RepID=UPI0023DC8784|nr:TetR/AcrR family transcriptional regulator [Hoeflea sp. YIM 152468]MDF1606582.1 TetR/AcrR family transcriptional regulator [Hoeflea sp. YIM 152468]
MDTATTNVASQRAADILDRVKSVFAISGFDGTSMQDLAQAAQMSVGNFYRYFPSKDAIIIALVKRDLMEIEAVFDVVKTAADPGAMLMKLLRERIETLPFEDAALWSEVQAASYRSDEIATLMRTMDDMVRSNIVMALVRIHGDDKPGAMQVYKTRAHLLMLLIHGFAQRKYCTHETGSPEQSAALGELVLATLHDTIFAPPTNPAD